MKILHLLGAFRLPRHPDDDGYSGIARATLELARTQARRGHTVTVASVGPQAWSEEWRGVTLRQLRQLNWAKVQLAGRSLDLSGHLPYLLHTHRERYDVIHGQMYPSLRGLRGRARVTHFHSDPGDLPAAVVARAVATSQVQIGVSDFVTGGLQQRLPGQGQMLTVPNGVDLEQFRPERWAAERTRLRQSWQATEGDVVVLYAGAVVPEKGLLPLVQAYGQLRAQLGQVHPVQVHLVVAGDAGLWDLTTGGHPSGDYDAQLRKASGVVPGIHWLGRVGAGQMAAIYAACEVLVVPSLVSETFSLSAAEAMASGLPVVVSASGALPGVIGAAGDTSAGLSVPPGDVPALKVALERLATDPDLRRRLAAHARQRASTLGWDAAVLQLDLIYERALAGLPVPRERRAPPSLPPEPRPANPTVNPNC